MIWAYLRRLFSYVLIFSFILHDVSWAAGPAVHVLIEEFGASRQPRIFAWQDKVSPSDKSFSDAPTGCEPLTPRSHAGNDRQVQQGATNFFSLSKGDKNAMSSTFKIKTEDCHFAASIDPLGQVNVLSMDSRVPLFITTFGDIRLGQNHCKAHILGLKGRSVYNNTRLTIDHYLLLDAFGKESWPLQNMASGRLSVTGTMDLRQDFQNTGFFEIPQDLTINLNGHKFQHLKTHGDITDLKILGTLRMIHGNHMDFSGPVNKSNGRKEGSLFIQTKAFENHDQIHLKQLTVHGDHMENHGAITGDAGSIHTNHFLDNTKDSRITFRDLLIDIVANGTNSGVIGGSHLQFAVGGIFQQGDSGAIKGGQSIHFFGPGRYNHGGRLTGKRIDFSGALSLMNNSDGLIEATTVGLDLIQGMIENNGTITASRIFGRLGFLQNIKKITGTFKAFIQTVINRGEIQGFGRLKVRTLHNYHTIDGGSMALKIADRGENQGNLRVRHLLGKGHLDNRHELSLAGWGIQSLTNHDGGIVRGDNVSLFPSAGSIINKSGGRLRVQNITALSPTKTKTYLKNKGAVYVTDGARLGGRVRNDGHFESKELFFEGRTFLNDDNGTLKMADRGHFEGPFENRAECTLNTPRLHFSHLVNGERIHFQNIADLHVVHLENNKDILLSDMIYNPFGNMDNRGKVHFTAPVFLDRLHTFTHIGTIQCDKGAHIAMAEDAESQGKVLASLPLGKNRLYGDHIHVSRNVTTNHPLRVIANSFQNDLTLTAQSFKAQIKDKVVNNGTIDGTESVAIHCPNIEKLGTIVSKGDGILHGVNEDYIHGHSGTLNVGGTLDMAMTENKSLIVTQLLKIGKDFILKARHFINRGSVSVKEGNAILTLEQFIQNGLDNLIGQFFVKKGAITIFATDFFNLFGEIISGKEMVIRVANHFQNGEDTIHAIQDIAKQYITFLATEADPHKVAGWRLNRKNIYYNRPYHTGNGSFISSKNSIEIHANDIINKFCTLWAQKDIALYAQNDAINLSGIIYTGGNGLISARSFKNDMLDIYEWKGPDFNNNGPFHYYVYDENDNYRINNTGGDKHNYPVKQSFRSTPAFCSIGGDLMFHIQDTLLNRGSTISAGGRIQDNFEFAVNKLHYKVHNRRVTASQGAAVHEGKTWNDFRWFSTRIALAYILAAEEIKFTEPESVENRGVMSSSKVELRAQQSISNLQSDFSAAAPHPILRRGELGQYAPQGLLKFFQPQGSGSSASSFTLDGAFPNIKNVAFHLAIDQAGERMALKEIRFRYPQSVVSLALRSFFLKAIHRSYLIPNMNDDDHVALFQNNALTYMRSLGQDFLTPADAALATIPLLYYYVHESGMAEPIVTLPESIENEDIFKYLSHYGATTITADTKATLGTNHITNTGLMFGKDSVRSIAKGRHFVAKEIVTVKNGHDYEDHPAINTPNYHSNGVLEIAGSDVVIAGGELKAKEELTVDSDVLTVKPLILRSHQETHSKKRTLCGTESSSTVHHREQLLRPAITSGNRLKLITRKGQAVLTAPILKAREGHFDVPHGIDFPVGWETLFNTSSSSSPGFLTNTARASGSSSRTPVSASIDFHRLAISGPVAVEVTDAQQEAKWRHLLEESGIPITFRHVASLHHTWDHTQKTLGTGVMTCIAIGLGLVMPAMGAGITGVMAKGAAVYLGTQGAAHLYANGGDPFQTIHHMATDRDIRRGAAKAAAMAAIGPGQVQGMSFTHHLIHSLHTMAAHVAVETTIGNGDFRSVIHDGFLLGARELLSTYGASQIGAAYKKDILGGFDRLATHAALAAAAHAATNGDPVAGAVGAVIAELVADYYKDQVLNPSDLDRDSESYAALVERGTAIARMVAAMSAALIGRNPDDAAFSAGAAVTYNALSRADTLEQRAKAAASEYEQRVQEKILAHSGEYLCDEASIQRAVAHEMIQKYKLHRLKPDQIRRLFAFQDPTIVKLAKEIQKYWTTPIPWERYQSGAEAHNDRQDALVKDQMAHCDTLKNWDNEMYMDCLQGVDILDAFKAPMTVGDGLLNVSEIFSLLTIGGAIGKGARAGLGAAAKQTRQKITNQATSSSSALPFSSTPWDMRAYVREMENATGFHIGKKQSMLLGRAVREKNYLKLEGLEKKTHRARFDASKNRLIREWENQTGQTWPRYEKKVLLDRTGMQYEKIGNRWDAHEIIPNSHGGPLEWWNITPARAPDQHQKIIHGADSALKKLTESGK